MVTAVHQHDDDVVAFTRVALQLFGASLLLTACGQAACLGPDCVGLLSKSSFCFEVALSILCFAV
jgi:hypothetical protein